MNQSPQSQFSSPPQSIKIILAIAFVSACVALPVISFVIGQPVEGTATEGSAELIQGILGTAAILALVIGHALASRTQTQQQFPFYIISLALREACAILGFIISLLSGDPMWSVGASLVAIFSIIGTFPKR